MHLIVPLRLQATLLFIKPEKTGGRVYCKQADCTDDFLGKNIVEITFYKMFKSCSRST